MAEKDSSIEIIDNPKLRNLLRVIGELGFTTVMWLFWIYLLLPVLSILLWLLGIHFFYHEIIHQAGYKHLLTLFKNLGFTVLVVFITLRVWGYYNYLAFGKRNRRKAVRPAHPADLGKFFGLSTEEILSLQSRKEIFWPVKEQ